MQEFQRRLHCWKIQVSWRGKSSPRDLEIIYLYLIFQVTRNTIIVIASHRDDCCITIVLRACRKRYLYVSYVSIIACILLNNYFIFFIKQFGADNKFNQSINQSVNYCDCVTLRCTIQR